MRCIKNKEKQILEPEAKELHNRECRGKCSYPALIKRPLGTREEIKFLSIKWYAISEWSCIKCGWTSETIKERITT